MDFASLIPSFGGFAWTAIAFVVALSIIVTVHEFGHYIVGRWSGIRAEVFSVGFGPVLASRTDRHGTRWQVAALPLGGYVKFLGDANAASVGPDEAALARLSADERRHTMHGAPLWARAVTVAAGPVFNFLLSILIFAGFFLVSGFATDTPTVGRLHTLPGPAGQVQPGDVIRSVEGVATPDLTALLKAPDDLPSTPVLTYVIERGGQEMTVEGPTLFPARAASVMPGSAAADAGLMKGDVILRANGSDVVAFRDLQRIVAAAEGRPIPLTVWRDGQTLEVTLAPRKTDTPTADGGFETKYLIGITGDFFFSPATRAVGPVEAVSAAASQVWAIISSSLSGLWHMITGAISSCNLRGPIGIAETSGAAASAGGADFLWFIAVLSTAVGFLNLFPIPMLDGGHLVFYTWEWATGRPPTDRALNLLMSIGLVVVLSLMAFGLTNDLVCP